MRFNIKFYEPYSDTFRHDPAIDERLITINSYSTYFPAGLYGNTQLIIPLLDGVTTKLQGRDRVVIKESLKTVWEGEIDEILYSFFDDGKKVVLTVNCIGHWGGLLKREGINCKYCDEDLSDSWQEDTTGTAYELCNHSKPKGTVVLKPKNEEWANNLYARFKYTSPTGQVVSRFKCLLNFAQASDWLDVVVENLAGANFFARTTAETAGVHDNDFSGTADGGAYITLLQNSGSAQTMPADGTFKMEMYRIRVYAFASNDTYVPEVYLENIAKHCISEVSNLNSDTTKIDTPSTSFAIEPFTTNNWEDWASILTRAASYGDGETTPTQRYVRLEASATAASGAGGKPVLASRAFPTLTETDYRIRAGEDVLQSELELKRDFGAIVNWVSVEYTDTDGVEQTYTPDDNAGLTNVLSVAKWGTYKETYKIGKANSTLAYQYGKRKLKRYKNPPWIVKSNIVVKGHIRKSGSGIELASQIESGKRIKLENVFSDMSSSGEVGTGLTFYITSTNYNPETDECSIGVGVADDAAALLAQIKLAYS